MIVASRTAFRSATAFLLLFVLLFACAAVCATSIVGRTEDTIAAPSPLLLADMDHVTRVENGRGEVVFERAQGHINIAYDVPMRSDARFMIGSNTKLFTTVAIYQLQERGLLNVDADIATMLTAADFTAFGLPGQTSFCPKVVNGTVCEKITLRHLLGMTSGLYPQLDCSSPEAVPGECNLLRYAVGAYSVASVVGAFINFPLTMAPGAAFQYSNPNFVLATYFVEKYSGLSFGAYVRQYITDPVGITADVVYDRFNGALGLADPLRATEYYKYYDNVTFKRLAVGQVRIELDPGAVNGAGGMIGSQRGVRLLWRAVFNLTANGAPLFANHSSQEAILTPHVFAQMFAVGGNRTAFAYYTQGMGVLCFEADCPGGPDYVNYMGGTFAAHTQNVMRMKDGAIAQVWTSCVQSLTTAQQLAEAQASSTGYAFQYAGAWSAGTPDVVSLSFAYLDQYCGSA